MLSAAEISPDSDTFLWGLVLFNHGHYWEAHEAWDSVASCRPRRSASDALQGD
nr:DUF309 domain-containing protein [Mesorhizobium sp.]